MSFIHLSLHTEYSLVDSVNRVPKLVNRVAEAGMAAVALIDQSFSWVVCRFSGGFRALRAPGFVPCGLLTREVPSSILTIGEGTGLNSR